MMSASPAQQRGASIITAIFIITALAALAVAMTRMTVHSNLVVADDYLAQQALYAAESGVEWAAYDILSGGGGGATVDAAVSANSWYTTTVISWIIDNGSADQRIYYEITSIGEAGGTAAAPRVQRLVTVYFMP